MTEAEQATALVVQWIPLLTMDVAWEASWRQTVLKLSSATAPIKEFDQKSDQEAHIHFFAYEAQWHKKIKKDGAIEAAVLNWPPNKHSRVVLIACDKAGLPKVNEKHVQILSNEALSNLGKQHHTIRAYTTELLRSETEMLLLQSLIERGMISPEYGSSDLDMQYKAQNESLEPWDARGI